MNSEISEKEFEKLASNHVFELQFPKSELDEEQPKSSRRQTTR